MVNAASSLKCYDIVDICLSEFSNEFYSFLSDTE